VHLEVNQPERTAETSMSGWQRALRRFPSNAAAALLLLTVVVALAWPIIEYDSWSYHLPFSARLFGDTSFHMDSTMERRWQGFTLVWNWLQGFFWWLTGSLRATALPQLALLAAYFWSVGRELQVRRSLLVIGVFASPLLILHQQGILNDLPTGLCLATGFLLLLQSEDRRMKVLAALLLALAGNIKVQGLIGVYIVSVIAVAFRPRIALVVAVAALLASTSALSNFARFGNPLYPFNSALFAGPENPMVDANPPRYEIGSRSFTPPQPFAFALSATELDWTLRGVAPRYSTAMEAGNAPAKGGPSRTGGWGWLFVLINAALLIVQLVRKERLAFATAAAILLVAFVPRSHELRYWLFLPLVLLPVNLRYLRGILSERTQGIGLLVMTGYAIIQTGLNPNSKLFFRDPVYWPVPPQIRDGYCDPNRDALLFRYSRAVTGANVTLSQRRDDCPQFG
jgi:hypothetical protein